jgi:hypothetical protein
LRRRLAKTERRIKMAIRDSSIIDINKMGIRAEQESVT